MTTRKKTTDEEATPAEVEVTDAPEVEGPRTFTYTFDGEDMELEDRWKREGKVPGGLPLLMAGGKDALKFVTPVIKSIIGIDQMEDLMEQGLAGDEWADVAQAWLKGRGLGNDE